MTEELKPCPKCKTANYLKVWETDMGKHFVRCEHCFAQGRTRAKRARAIAEWNRWSNDD